MSDYRSIKDLVIETYMSEGGIPSYEKLTSLVREHFPTSKWNKSHYAYYKYKIKRGDIAIPGFGDLEDLPVDNGNEIESEILATIDARISLEKDLHTYLAARVGQIESGLILAENGIEYQTDAGRIDILANDPQGCPVVIELKAGRAKDNALGQLLGYMGCIASNSHNREKEIRGILVASKFEQRVIYAARGLPSVKLLKYIVSFELQEVDNG